MITCTVYGCMADRANGDVLFCPDCRGDWTNICKKIGIAEFSLPQKELDIILRKFQDRLQ